MCTLLLGRDVLGAGTLVIAANRDEDPARPSEPPRRLADRPPVAGGRDLRAGGTWLAVRGGEQAAVAALLNRRPLPGAAPARRSRGVLPVELAVAGAPRTTALALAESGDFAPCTLLWASRSEAWLVAIPGDSPARWQEIPPGWHALAHAELDDANEPRTAWLTSQLAGLEPRSVEEAFASLTLLLASHGVDGAPPVCLHEGRMRTVSATRVAIGPFGVRYEHAEGFPCTTPFQDHHDLLADAGGSS